MKSEHNNAKAEIERIPKDWNILQLCGCAELIIDYRGKTPKKLGGAWSPTGGFRALSAKNVKNGQIVNDDSIRYVDSELYKKWMQQEVRRGDILLTSEAPLGESMLWDSEEKIVLSQRLFGVRPNTKIVYPKYLYAYISSSTFKHELESRATGTTVLGIRQSELVKTRVIVPPMDEQVLIGDLYYGLSRKLPVNHDTNVTLGKISQTIFKHWFVDFEFPNEEGNPYKSSGGEMVESELEEIPKGWTTKSMGDVLELAYGKALKDSERHPGVIPVFGSNGQVGWHDEKLVDGSGIIVGRKGNPGVITLSLTSFFPIDTTFYVVSKGLIKSVFYLFHALRAQNLSSLAADSAVPGLNRNIAYMNQIIVPPREIVERFDECVSGMYWKVQAINEESRALGAIRDALLPRLMSGEIRVGHHDQTRGAD